MSYCSTNTTDSPIGDYNQCLLRVLRLCDGCVTAVAAVACDCDYSLECYDTNWGLVCALAVPVIVFFSLGMPFSFAYMLYKRRHRLDEPSVKKLLGVLYSSYRPECFYFESVQMIFKLSLWACLVFFEQGSQFQIAAGGLICVIQLVVNVKLTPFRYATEVRVVLVLKYCIQYTNW